MTSSIGNNLYQRAFDCLMSHSASGKIQEARKMIMDWHLGRLHRQDGLQILLPELPGLPGRLTLVHPSTVERRNPGTREGRKALLHAIAHIEFSAINLALDAVYRFRDMPDEYYDDWLRVCAEECYHFSMLRQMLRESGIDYGDLPAHRGLWDVARYSAEDVLHRMALVPRVLEARGLDVTPGMIERVLHTGDRRLADVLQIILRDEIGHVRTGSQWFGYLCDQRGLDRMEKFGIIINHYMEDMNARINGPFQYDMRIAAGFSPGEMALLREFQQ